MLEQIPYIDACDTLGQRANRTDIHKVIHVEFFGAILMFVDTRVCISENIGILHSRTRDSYRERSKVGDEDGLRD